VGGKSGRESSSRCRRFPYAFSGIGRAEFSKKMVFLMNTNGQQSDTSCLLGQSRRILDDQIRRSDQIVGGRNGLNGQLSFAKMLRNSKRPNVALQKPAGVVEKPSDSQARERPDFDIPTSALDLFCCAQRRTEITKFVVDFVWPFDSLSNFFAKQRAIPFA
jgi:hypothetical protein